ncbi:hypothetical protein COCNU_01G018950 [Cocos nucifera]|uniref:Uncharacterized protein n=1 Tax=Cocos nucifera TaxID=13894 RepID=A0A8K0HWU3_COCNU|nr:hypothetical protein COCNU_01G018950 [Cocos nucifera]
MGGCASKPREFKGGMNASLIWDEHGEKEEEKDVKQAAGGQQEQENGRQSLGFLLKQLEAKEAEECKAEHHEEGPEAETITTLPDEVNYN